MGFRGLPSSGTGKVHRYQRVVEAALESLSPLSHLARRGVSVVSVLGFGGWVTGAFGSTVGLPCCQRGLVAGIQAVVQVQASAF